MQDNFKPTDMQPPPGTAPGPEFAAFLKVWQTLPRRTHPLVPARADYTPKALGTLLPNTGIGRFTGRDHLDILYYGSEIERLSGIAITGKNYYAVLRPDYREQMIKFHALLRDTPCGAYMVDTITTASGTHYLYESLQLPLADEAGEISYLIGFGIGRKPAGDYSERPLGDHRRSNVKEMHYLDLGAGAPTARIENYTFYRA